MEEKLINLIYAMIVGNIISGKIDGQDIWDDEKSVKYYTELVLMCMPEKETYNG